MGILDDTEFDEVMRLQKQLASTMMNEYELDAKIKLLVIFNEVIGKRKKIQTEELIVEAENQGMTEIEITATIEKLKKDGILFEPQPGYLQKR
ncbi:MAG: hypothetical protein QXK76_01785 [Candidatus Woesearchaeota archaeon]